MITLILVVISVITSLLAFQNASLKSEMMFMPYRVSRRGEWYRFFSSGFIHGGWLHLIINMYVLYEFGSIVERFYGQLFGQWSNLLFLLLYFGGMVAADIPTFLNNRSVPHYASLGASGAVSAVVFAFILMAPTHKLMLLFLPIPMSAWVLGAIYIVYSFIAARRGGTNINHSAHLFGAIFGFSLTILLKPALFQRFIEQILNI